MVVHFFKSQTGLGAEHPHFIVGEQSVVQGGHAQDHVTVGVPSVEMDARGHVLGGTFGEPWRYDGEGDGVRCKDIRITRENIVAPLFVLVAQIVEVNGRQAPWTLAGRLQGDDVGEFMGDHVPEPVGVAAQFEIQVGCPDFHGVVVIEGRAIGVVVGVLYNQADFFVRCELVKLRNRSVHGFGGRCGATGKVGEALMVVYFEVRGLQDLPAQFGMVGVELGACRQ